MNDDTDKTYKCTCPLRWGEPRIDIYTITGYAKDLPVLQQAWECVETGEIEWRDVQIGGD